MTTVFLEKSLPPAICVWLIIIIIIIVIIFLSVLFTLAVNCYECIALLTGYWNGLLLLLLLLLLLFFFFLKCVIYPGCQLLRMYSITTGYWNGDRLCGLVVRVSGYRYRGLGFDSRGYQIF